MLEAARIAHAAGRTVAFTLSESLCIGDRREGVMGMIECGHGRHPVRQRGRGAAPDRLQRARRLHRRAVGRRSATLVDHARRRRGAIAIEDGERVEIPAAPVAQGRRHDRRRRPVRRRLPRRALPRARRSSAASKPGSLAAAEVISHFGARPEADLKRAGAAVKNVRRLAVYCGSATGIAAGVRRVRPGRPPRRWSSAASTSSMAAGGSG